MSPSIIPHLFSFLISQSGSEEYSYEFIMEDIKVKFACCTYSFSQNQRQLKIDQTKKKKKKIITKCMLVQFARSWPASLKTQNQPTKNQYITFSPAKAHQESVRLRTIKQEMSLQILTLASSLAHLTQQLPLLQHWFLICSARKDFRGLLGQFFTKGQTSSTVSLTRIRIYSNCLPGKPASLCKQTLQSNYNFKQIPLMSQVVFVLNCATSLIKFLLLEGRALSLLTLFCSYQRKLYK